VLNASNSISVGAPPQTPLGELKYSPRSPSRIKGPTSIGKGREERLAKGGYGREGRGDKGEEELAPVQPLVS